MSYPSDAILKQIEAAQVLLQNNKETDFEKIKAQLEGVLNTLKETVEEISQETYYSDEEYNLIAEENAHFGTFLESLGFNTEEVSNIANNAAPSIKINKRPLETQIKAQRFAKQNRWEYVGILNNKAICKKSDHEFTIHDVCTNSLENGRYVATMEEAEDIAFEKIKSKCEILALEEYFDEFPLNTNAVLSQICKNTTEYNDSFTPKQSFEDVPSSILSHKVYITYSLLLDVAKEMIHHEIQEWRESTKKASAANAISSFLLNTESLSNHLKID